ncbi:MAG TPA: tetratricopeptide repeat protein [Pyrinomonadaceae bacterium]
MQHLTLTLRICLVFFVSSCAVISQDTNVRQPTKESQTAEEYYQYALSLNSLSKASAKKAIKALDKAIELKPDFAAAYHTRGFYKMEVGDPKGAIEDFNSAIKLNPYHLTYMLRAEARVKLNDLDGAMSDYNYVLSTGRVCAAYTARGKLKFQKGDLDGAIADFSEATSMCSSDAAYFYRGLARKRKGDLDGALADLKVLTDDYEYIQREVEKKYPRKSKETEEESTIGGQGIIMRDEEGNEILPKMNFKDKLSEKYWFEVGRLEISLNSSEDMSVLYLFKGDLLEEKGEEEAALTAFNNAIQVWHENFAAYVEHGKIQSKRGALAKAIKDFTRAILIEPQFPDAYAERGITLLLQGNDAAAQQDFDRYLKFVPDMKEHLTSRIEKAKEMRAAKSKSQ